MDFPATECEFGVFAHLGLPKDYRIPFGISQYIHVACGEGFHYEEIAVRVARLLSWATVLKNILEKYPNLATIQGIEVDLKSHYLGHGADSEFLDCVRQHLAATQLYSKEAEALKKKIGQKSNKERASAWKKTLSQFPPVNSVPFKEELRAEFELFGLPQNELQKHMLEKAANEKSPKKGVGDYSPG